MDRDERLALKLYYDRMGQICKVCFKRDKFDFHVSDEIWNAIVPKKYRDHVVCLSCFDEFAFDKDIDYSDSLEVLYFSGDQANFSFTVKSRKKVNWEDELN